MKAYTLELSGDEHGRLIAVVDAAIFAGEHEINEVLQEEPWVDYDWSIESLLADPGQIKRADPEDDNLGSDLRELVYGLRDAREFLTMLEALPGRCEGCGASSENCSNATRRICAPLAQKSGKMSSSAPPWTGGPLWAPFLPLGTKSKITCTFQPPANQK
jgi:hypothetical protein